MTILVDWEIEKLAEEGMISPYDPELLNPQSYDIRLANKFGAVVPTGTVRTLNGYIIGDNPTHSEKFDGRSAIDPGDPNSFKTTWEEKDLYVLRPGEFVLAGTSIAVKYPENIVGEVRGKSSIGRLAIANTSLFAGFIDGGFEAETIVLEIVNLGKYAVLLRANAKIGQLVFFKTETPRNSYKKTGRYNNQSFQGSKGTI
jgi:dCTP deaminase